MYEDEEQMKWIQNIYNRTTPHTFVNTLLFLKARAPASCGRLKAFLLPHTKSVLTLNIQSLEETFRVIFICLCVSGNPHVSAQRQLKKAELGQKRLP